MISEPLLIILAVTFAVIVIALIVRMPGRPSIARRNEDSKWSVRDVALVSTIMSFAASLGLARAQAERDDGSSWYGSHLDHGAGGGFSDGGGFGGGDAGGGGI